MRYIRCQLPGTVVVERAIPSNRRYVWTDANQIPIGTGEQDISPDDVPDLLTKKQSYRACCNSPDQNLSIFVEVED